MPPADCSYCDGYGHGEDECPVLRQEKRQREADAEGPLRDDAAEVLGVTEDWFYQEDEVTTKNKEITRLCRVLAAERYNGARLEDLSASDKRDLMVEAHDAYERGVKW